MPAAAFCLRTCVFGRDPLAIRAYALGGIGEIAVEKTSPIMHALVFRISDAAYGVWDALDIRIRLAGGIAAPEGAIVPQKALACRNPRHGCSFLALVIFVEAAPLGGALIFADLVARLPIARIPVVSNPA